MPCPSRRRRLQRRSLGRRSSTCRLFPQRGSSCAFPRCKRLALCPWPSPVSCLVALTAPRDRLRRGSSLAPPPRPGTARDVRPRRRRRDPSPMLERCPSATRRAKRPGSRGRSPGRTAAARGNPPRGGARPGWPQRSLPTAGPTAANRDGAAPSRPGQGVPATQRPVPRAQGQAVPVPPRGRLRRPHDAAKQDPRPRRGGAARYNY